MAEGTPESDIFDEMAAGMAQAPEASPFVDIFAPEFIGRFAPDDLLAATRGVVRAITGRYHPDAISGKANPEIADQARRQPEPDEPATVAKLRESMQTGAAIVDEFKGIEEAVGANPLKAKVSALRAVRNERGYVPGRRRPQTSSAINKIPEVPVTITPEQGKYAEFLPSPERQRELLEQFRASEALINIGNCYILSRFGAKRAILYELWANDGDRSVSRPGTDSMSSKNTAGLWAREMTLRRPIKSVTKGWEVAGKEYYDQKQDSEYWNSDRYDVVLRGGIRLRFDLPEDAEKATLGRQTISDIIDRLNSPRDEMIKSPIKYQLAVLGRDGRYEFMPTSSAHGEAYGVGPEKADVELSDWMQAVYGTLPGCFYVVNEGDDTDNYLTLYAFTAESSTEEELISPNLAGVIRSQTADFRVELLGFLTDTVPYEANGEASETVALGTGEKASFARQQLGILGDDTDIAFLSGSSRLFYPVKSFHQRKRQEDNDDNENPALVIRSGVFHLEPLEETSPHADLHYNPEEPNVFAIKHPVAIGIRSTSIDPSRAMRKMQQKQNRQKVIEELSQKVSQHLGAVVTQAVQEVIDNKNLL